MGEVWGDLPFLWSADLTGIRCSFLQKSSSGYIKLLTTQGGGPWECVVMREVVGHLPFFCVLKVPPESA